MRPVATGAFPVEPHEGVASVAISERDAPHLVSDSLRGTIGRVALPAVASSLLMTLFASVDAFWVGTKIGPAGLAAVSTSLFWIWMVVAVGEMFGVGLTAVASRRRGEHRPSEAASVAADTLLLSLAAGVLLAMAGVWQLDRLFAVMGTPASVTALGRSYLGTYFAGAPLIFGFLAIDAAFRAAGDTRTPFVILAGSVAVTLVLDPVLLLGLGPIPRLGIVGAAVATVLTRGGAFVVGLILAWRRRLLDFSRHGWASLLAVCRVGVPTALTGVVFSLIYVALTRTTTRFGTPALAALGIGHRVESWLYMIGVGTGAATAAIVGQNLGAGNQSRAEQAGWIAVGFCTIFGVLACIAELLWPQGFASLFTSDPATIGEGARYLRVSALSQSVICAEIVLEASLGGAGDTIPPMVTSTALTLSRLPLAAWAASRWGTLGIWWVISLTAIGRGLAMMALWRGGRWKRRSV